MAQSGSDWRRSRALIGGLAWVYLAAVALVWLLISFSGDKWWLATILMFGPRWVYALPLPLLAAACLLVRRKSLVVLVAAAVICFGPLMGFELPRWRTADPTAQTLRVITCNIQNRNVDRQALLEFVARSQADVVALQECTGVRALAWPADWHAYAVGEFMVASRYKILEAEQPRNKQGWAEGSVLRCKLAVPGGSIELFTVHLETPRNGLQAVLGGPLGLRLSKVTALTANIEHRDEQSARNARWIKQFSGDVVVAGDFNMPIESAIYRRHWSWLPNAFSIAGCGYGMTKITSQGSMQYGARIDHVLYGPSWRCVGCEVGPALGSDHLPLVAELHRPLPTGNDR